MQLQARPLAELGQRGDLAWLVSRSKLRGLRDADSSGLHLMHRPSREACKGSRDSHRVDLSVRSRQGNEFGAMRKKFWRPTFIHRDMASRMANGGSMWRYDRRERQRVCG